MGMYHTITQLLRAYRRGDQEAYRKLFALLYDDLRHLAHRQLHFWGFDKTINTTALVHEAYIKMAHQDQLSWTDRAHFISIAATVMRHFLVDYARKRKADKRGGNAPHTRLDASLLFAEDTTVEMLDLDAALNLLAETDPRTSAVIEMRFFGGLTTKEIAEVLGISERSVRRDLFAGKSFLRLALGPGEEN